MSTPTSNLIPDKTKSEHRTLSCFLKVRFQLDSSLTNILRFQQARKVYIDRWLYYLRYQVISSIQLNLCSLVHVHIKSFSKLDEDSIFLAYISLWLLVYVRYIHDSWFLIWRICQIFLIGITEKLEWTLTYQILNKSSLILATSSSQFKLVQLNSHTVFVKLRRQNLARLYKI